MWPISLIIHLYLSGIWQGVLSRMDYKPLHLYSNEIVLCAQNIPITLSSTFNIIGKVYVIA